MFTTPVSQTVADTEETTRKKRSRSSSPTGRRNLQKSNSLHQKNDTRDANVTTSANEPSAKAQGAMESSVVNKERALAAVDAAYASVDGYAIARGEVRAQRARGIFVEGAQYGEIDSRVFASALKRLALVAGERFVDVGSGTGKAVLTAAAIHRLERATGVEIQEPLHAAAMAARQRLSLSTSDVRLICGDAFAYNWQEYDVVFVNAAVFTQEMVDQIDEGAEHLKPGARILISTRPLSSPLLSLLWQEKLKTGKGSLFFRAYQRVTLSR